MLNFLEILEKLCAQSTSSRISAGAAVLAKITSVCAKIYGLGVTSRVFLQLPKKVTKCGKRFFKEECVLLNNNQAIPQIQAEETHEKQGFCASRDNTESLHEEYTQWGNNKKKVPFWKKW